MMNRRAGAAVRRSPYLPLDVCPVGEQSAPVGANQSRSVKARRSGEIPDS